MNEDKFPVVPFELRGQRRSSSLIKDFSFKSFGKKWSKFIFSYTKQFIINIVLLCYLHTNVQVLDSFEDGL